MQSINVSDQYAYNSVTQSSAVRDAKVPVIETALQHVNLLQLAVRTASGQGVALTELPVRGLLVLRTRDDKSVLNKALSALLKLNLPGVLASTTSDNGDASYCARWMAPDEWLLSCPLQNAFSIEQTLRENCGDASFAVVNVSGGFTSLMLKGPHANDVLKKSVVYDVHPSHFAPGKVVNTVFAKAQVTLRCVDDAQYELFVRRSFADYVWHWLQVASAEYGLSIEIAE